MSALAANHSTLPSGDVVARSALCARLGTQQQQNALAGRARRAAWLAESKNECLQQQEIINGSYRVDGCEEWIQPDDSRRAVRVKAQKSEHHCAL